MRRFNGVQVMFNDDPVMLSLEQLLETDAIVCCCDAQMWGGGSYHGQEYWSRTFPDWLKDPAIPINIKEFWVVLVSAWLWADKWSNKVVHIFCDNDAVVDTLDKEKPKDPSMQELFREFLYIVCSKRFTPVFRKIGSKVHDHNLIKKFFSENKLPIRKQVEVPDILFKLQSNW